MPLEEGQPGPDPREMIGKLLADARLFRDDYEAPLTKYLANTRGVDFIATVLSLEDVSDVLYEDWEQTADYRQLRGRFDALVDRTIASLQVLVGKGGRDLKGALQPVTKAVRLETKVRQLVAVLETLQTQTIRYRTERIARGTTPRRPSSRARTFHEAEAWGLVAVAIGILGVAAPLGVLAYGWLYGVLIAGAVTLVAVVVLVLLRSWWVPRLARLLRTPPR